MHRVDRSSFATPRSPKPPKQPWFSSERARVTTQTRCSRGAAREAVAPAVPCRRPTTEVAVPGRARRAPNRRCGAHRKRCVDRRCPSSSARAVAAEAAAARRTRPRATRRMRCPQGATLPGPASRHALPLSRHRGDGPAERGESRTVDALRRPFDAPLVAIEPRTPKRPVPDRSSRCAPSSTTTPQGGGDSSPLRASPTRPPLPRQQRLRDAAEAEPPMRRTCASHSLRFARRPVTEATERRLKRPGARRQQVPPTRSGAASGLLRA